MYTRILKQYFFLFDPEHIHESMIRLGKFLGSFSLGRGVTCIFFSYAHSFLEQDVCGIHFKNPIGLAAGFDKNAELTSILPSMGFGFAEVGSVTGEPCEGNPKPRLWRLKKSKSLLVYYGLKNDGCEVIAGRLKNKKCTIPIGISIAKTNCAATVETETGIADYKKAYETFVRENIGDYYTINISCPNAYGGEPFTDAEKLEGLLAAIDGVQNSKPIFLKISPDLSREHLDALIAVVDRHHIAGFICTNLTKKRDNKKILDTSVPDVGGMSGLVVRDLSDEMISYLYKKTRGRYVIIGCGGVFTAEDAYRKIRNGASLVQMITGMIFEGPQVISAINQGLVRLMKKDGFHRISDAVGANYR
ncbi:quinone-dependent dihydroorotate dehydrogenase [Candidatus Uhrbacteria bacterium]|nr:quinone-dependent dihydroorotate dehydrogenase [Candidatus Uhrbacteria bacterium]